MDIMLSCLDEYATVIDRLAGEGELKRIEPIADEFRRVFEDAKVKISGFWKPVEERLRFLEMAIGSSCPKPYLLAGVQQLICVSKLCFGTYFYGSGLIRAPERCKYNVLPDNEMKASVLTVAVLLEDEKALEKHKGGLQHLTDSGHEVIVFLQDSIPDEAQSEAFTVYCLPTRLCLQTLFDLAFYSCGTEYLMFVCDRTWGGDAIDLALREIREDASVACVLFKDMAVTSDVLVPGFLECGLAGIYRTKAIKEIGSLDCLFADDNYLSEDYRIRAEALGFSVLSLGCPDGESFENSFPGYIERDSEAMLRKHGKEQVYKQSLTFVPEFFCQFKDSLSESKNIVLLHAGDESVAKSLYYMATKVIKEVTSIRIEDVSAGCIADADVVVYCFPICFCRDFDKIVCAATGRDKTNVIAFFDKNYLSTSDLEDALCDRAFIPEDNITIWHRKNLRDKIAAAGYNIHFSRITNKVSGHIEKNLCGAFPDSSDMIMKNVQTEYYTYVCTATEGE